MKAVIMGITGQDGSFLAESLLADGFEVHGMVRRTSQFGRSRIDRLREQYPERLSLFYGDLGEVAQFRRELVRLAPDFVYLLGGQSHVGISFEIPETTLQEVANATLSILEVCRDLADSPRILLVGSSEIFGAPDAWPQDESSPHRPTSPYGCAKSCAVQLGAVYRESFGMPVSTVIPYNHESIRRGENFVTRKITRAAARIAAGGDEVLELGNLGSERDWGYAPEYVAGYRATVEKARPDDFLFATGTLTSVREFAEGAFAALGMNLVFEGEGKNEVGRDRGSGRELIRVNPRYFRPSDPARLVGDAGKAGEKLGWKAQLAGTAVAARMAEGEAALLAGREPKI